MRYPNITPYKGEIRKIISVKVSIHSAIITIPELNEIDKLRADSFCTGLIRCRPTKTEPCSAKEKDIFRMQKKDFNESKDRKFRYSRKNEYLAITNKKEFYGEKL